MDEVAKQPRRDERAKVHAARLQELHEKQKRDSKLEGQTIPHTKSRIFKGSKILGHVSNHVPCVLRYIHERRENFIITCIGKSINTYASNQLSQLSVSRTLNTEISCMAGDTYHVYTASENLIYAWRRGVEIAHTYNMGHDDEICFLLPFGEHLISIDVSGVLCMRDIKTEELVSTMRFDVSTFRVTALMHPVTYINKILFASEQGTMQLWNVKKMKMIHLFSNWAGSSILFVAQAPAVDCVALALSKKRIVIHNIRYDITIMTLVCEDQPLTIGFRTDNVETMITGNSSGSLTLWDLNKKEVLQHVVGSHAESVTGLQCYHQEPLFLTSSPDNSLKLWIFDGPGGTFRELCARSGHAHPPGRVRFFGSTGFDVLSAGKDGRIRQFHIHNETINRSWGENKIPNDIRRRRTEVSCSPILDFTSQSVGGVMEYDDMALLTEDEAAVTTWSSHNVKQGSSSLFPLKKRVPNPDFVATCLCLTSCGQFVIVGYDNGAVHRYNIQSGQHRLAYRDAAAAVAHEGTVRGVAVDSINACVASGGADNCLKLWHFGKSEVIRQLTFSGGISALFRHRLVNTIGVILDNFEIVTIDLDSKNVVRKFSNISSPVQDATFSPDCRWLTASSTDCLMRTWDIPTGHMIDVFRLESIVTFMDYSPKGDYLVTALSDNIGILLWINATVYTYVSLMPVPPDFEPPIVDFSQLQELPEIKEPESRVTGYDYESPDHLEDNLITLSQVAETRWKSLQYLDTVRERNKPKQPPKQHAAPFFLPSELKAPSEIESSLAGSEKSKVENGEKSSAGNSGSKILSVNFALSPFAQGLLAEPKEPEYYEDLCTMLEKLGPSQIESEIICLGPDAGGSLDLLHAFFCFIQNVISSRRHTETSNAYLAHFLRTHSRTLLGNPEFKEIHTNLQEALVASAEDFVDTLYAVQGYVSMIKSGMY